MESEAWPGRAPPANWPGRGRVFCGAVLGGVIVEECVGGVSWASREANEALGARREREAEPMGFGGVSEAEPPDHWGRGGGGGGARGGSIGPDGTERYWDAAAAGDPGPRGRGAPGLGAARTAAALRRLGRPLRAGCGGSGVPGTASRRRLARLRLPRAACGGAAARRSLWHRARSAGAPPARVPLPARRGRQRGDAGAGTEHRAVPGAAAVRSGQRAAARARRALRRRDGGGGPGRGAGAEHGAAGAAAGHQAGRLPVPDNEKQPLKPAVQGGAGGSSGAAGTERSLAEAAGPGSGVLGEGHHRGGEHPGHWLHLRGGLHLPEEPCSQPRGGLRASMALDGGPVPAYPVPLFLEKRLHPSPQELFLSVRKWLCLSLFLTQDIPHLPHLPSSWLLSPFCFVPHVLGSLCPSVAVLLLPPHLSSTLSPGQLGVVAVPSPALACSINPCPC